MSSPARQMLRRIVAGDPEARTWLYDRFAPRLLRRLRQRYRGLDAEELLHDAYLLCLRQDAAVLGRGLDQLPEGEGGEAGVERLLWDQACGLASNRLRSPDHQRLVALSPFEPPGGGADPERTNLARDSLHQLDACLAASPPRIYLYFKLRYLDGLTPEEITTVTGWSRRSTYRAREDLNAALRRCAESLGLAPG